MYRHMYISAIISAADDGPDEMTCGSTLLINFPNKNVKNIMETLNSVFCELFREMMAKSAPLDLSRDISPYMRTFPKGRIYG